MHACRSTLEDPTNTTLDLIAKRLCSQSRPVGRDEIEKIVANPDLFSGVLRKVAEGEKRSKRGVSFLTPWKSVSAVGSFAVVALAIGWGVRYQQPPDYTAGTAALAKPITISTVPDIAVPDTARPGTPPPPITGKLSAGRAPKDSFRVEKTSTRSPASKLVPQRRIPVQTDEFHPVAYTGDPLETAGGGQVVRVEMKRSALFALGLAVPLENGDATVRADLLVGRDGVTRAVRLVD